LGFAGLFLPAVFWIVFLAGLGTGGVGESLACASRERFQNRSNQKIKTKKQREKKKEEFWDDRKEERLAAISLAILVGVFSLFGILQAAAPPCVRDSLVYQSVVPQGISPSRASLAY